MATQITKKEIMQTAWFIAKCAAYKHGGKARQYLAGAMKMAWDAAKVVFVSPCGKFLKVTSPVKFDQSFVARMKNTSGAYCRKEDNRFVWAIARTARGLVMFIETAAVTFGATWANSTPKTRTYKVAPVNDYNMYHPKGAYYG